MIRGSASFTVLLSAVGALADLLFPRPFLLLVVDEKRYYAGGDQHQHSEHLKSAVEPAVGSYDRLDVNAGKIVGAAALAGSAPSSGHGGPQ